jgi:hypothetical protein
MTRHVSNGGTYSTHMPVRIHIQRLRRCEVNIHIQRLRPREVTIRIQRLRPCEPHSARRRRLSAEATAVRTWTAPPGCGLQAAACPQGRPAADCGLYSEWQAAPSRPRSDSSVFVLDL